MSDPAEPDRSFEAYLSEIADRVTVALDQFIPRPDGPEAKLIRAMRHAGLGDGKPVSYTHLTLPTTPYV